MSAESQPITPARFAAALKDLPLSSLYLKLLELRNSIAHLDYSNEQLRPYAEGTAVALGTTTTTTTTTSPSPTSTSQPLPSGHQGPSPPPPVIAEPDQDCIDAIRENEEVIERMQERIRLLRVEVESRGVGWEDFQGEGVKDEEEEEGASQKAEDEQQEGQNGMVNGMVNGDGAASSATRGGGGGGGEGRHPAWSDGTFQTGMIRGGELHMDAVAGSRQGQGQAQQGGSLSDEELRRRMEEQMRNLGVGDDEDEDGGLYL
ncbi:hypothetical protein VTJ49DRAFT_261 [Mycothermus thermophilus]|uniref:Secondary alcohol dehydrogenase n=1 Tax=Humicola insolens TaxID=85995 RepID=A0ABR3VFK9_HUMIN